MAAAARHFRKHWKKYAIGTVVVGLGARYFAKRLRDNNVIREYCNTAKEYGEEISGVFVRPRKMMVFLNPKANNTEAKIQFTKYAAPLLYLSGMDVTIVESDYEGQIRTLMGYIDPKIDGIIVAGGDGTLMEVVNGLMRRHDAHLTRSIPIGVLPLGKENRFYRSYMSSRSSFSTPARRIGEATMDIILGNVAPAPIVEIQPENGRTVYAMSSVQWGAFKEAVENRDRFRFFGRLRTFFSYLNTALRKWPLDYQLHVWMPAKALTVDSSNHPPNEGPITRASPDHHVTLHDEDRERASSLKAAATFGGTLKSLLSLHAQCAGHQFSPSLQDVKPDPSRNTGLPLHSDSSITSLARGVEDDPQWKHKIFDVVGVELSLLHPENCLKLTVWPADTQKGSFIKQGWAESLKRPPLSLPCHKFQSLEFILQPCAREGSWLSVDGEHYEATPMALKMRPNTLRMFSRGGSEPT